jgi:hypothetical protein
MNSMDEHLIDSIKDNEYFLSIKDTISFYENLFAFLCNFTPPFRLSNPAKGRIFIQPQLILNNCLITLQSIDLLVDQMHIADAITLARKISDNLFFVLLFSMDDYSWMNNEEKGEKDISYYWKKWVEGDFDDKEKEKRFFAKMKRNILAYQELDQMIDFDDSNKNYKKTCDRYVHNVGFSSVESLEVFSNSRIKSLIFLSESLSYFLDCYMGLCFTTSTTLQEYDDGPDDYSRYSTGFLDYLDRMEAKNPNVYKFMDKMGYGIESVYKKLELQYTRSLF